MDSLSKTSLIEAGFFLWGKIVRRGQKTQLTISISFLIVVGGWVFDYASFKTAFEKQQTELKKAEEAYNARFDRIEVVQKANTLVVNTIDILESKVEYNSKSNQQFIDRFDQYLKVQQKMNEQLITLSVQQKYILKRLDGEISVEAN